MDNLARCAMLAKKEGMSYGKWMALHGSKESKKNKKKEYICPDGWRLCEWCGKPFKGKCGKRFCDIACRTEAYMTTHKEKIQEHNKRALERYHERKKKNENSC